MSTSDTHMEAARNLVDEWLSEQEGYAVRAERIPDGSLDWLVMACAIGAAEGVKEGMKRADWQPIETLVRDGREVLMFSPEQGQAVWHATEKTWPHVTHWAPLMPDPIDEAGQ